jgi:potassium-dependent mechanosensitive channel
MDTASSPFRPWSFLCRLLFLLPVMLVMMPLPILAQQAGQEKLVATWDESARRAEEALRVSLASTAAFEILRAELAEQRAEAETMAGEGKVLIRSLKAQIEALGPPPPKDGSEPAALAARRAELALALATAEEPPIAARQAFARADVLIEEIDRLIRARSAVDLLDKKPSPVSPASWSAADMELGRFFDKLKDEARRHSSLQPDLAVYFENRMLIALAVLVAVLLLPIGAGHYLLIYLERRITAAPSSLRFFIQAAGVHLMRLLLSLVAIGFLFAALLLLEWGVTSAVNLFGGMLGVSFIFLTASWIGNVLFTPHQPSLRLVNLSDGLARICYWLSMAFATSLAVELLVDTAAEDYAFSPAASAVLQGFSILIGCIVLTGLSRVLRAIAHETHKHQHMLEDTPFSPAFFSIAGRIMQVLALMSIVAASLGYVALARAWLAPTMLSLTIFGLAFILHHTIMMPIRAAMSDRKSTMELSSILLAFGMLVVSLPLVAVAWGAREAELSEAWRLLQNGIDFGGIRLSPKVLMVLGATFALGIFLTRWLQRIIDRVILPRTQVDPGGRNAIRTGLGYVGFILSVLLAISAAGLDLSNLAIIAGALSVGVGFGMQTIVSNFVSGIILLIERPIKEGDWIEVSGFSGTVRKIAVRSTRIETFDRHDVIIPNADLIAGTVKNMTLSSQIGRMIIPIGIAYGSEVERARDIMLQVALDHPGILSYPEPQVFFRHFGNSALDFELRCFLRDVGTELSIRSDLLFTLNAAFADAGIEIPFAQSDVTIRNLDEIVGKLPGLPADNSPQMRAEGAQS